MSPPDDGYGDTNELAPEIVFVDIWTEHNVYENGKKGLRIHMEFDTYDLKGADCKAVVWFSYGSGNQHGSPLQDYNNSFSTGDGQVAAWTYFKPPDNEWTYSDFEIFMPYDELHMAPGRSALEYDIGVFWGSKQIGENSWGIPFTLDHQ